MPRFLQRKQNNRSHKELCKGEDSKRFNPKASTPSFTGYPWVFLKAAKPSPKVSSFNFQPRPKFEVLGIFFSKQHQTPDEEPSHCRRVQLNTPLHFERECSCRHLVSAPKRAYGAWAPQTMKCPQMKSIPKVSC